jgi:membrane-bound metal-dependent hydrolase YbcI (DUF457 family)
MATPLGHYLVGLAVGTAVARDPGDRARMPWLAAVACVPDLDVIPGLVVGNPSQFHHGITHSVAAALLFAGASVLLGGRLGIRPSPRLFLLIAGLYTSHGLLDALTLDRSDPRGVPLLWPWVTTAYQSPWLLLPNVQHTSAPIVSTHNMALMVQEAFLFVPLVGLVRILRGDPGVPGRRVAWLYGAWFLTAVVVSLASLESF